MEKLIHDIKTALNGELPGPASHDKMMRTRRPTAQQSLKHDNPPRMSAVLMLLFPRQDVLHTSLILRPAYDGVHSAQISFPGGKMEESDNGLRDTALRETEEEIGVDRFKIEIIGELTPLYIPPSNFHVNPFVGFLDHTPDMVADPTEVDQIINIPVQELLDLPFLEKEIFIEKYNSSFPISYFDVEGHTVWGATAMILSEFRDLFQKA